METLLDKRNTIILVGALTLWRLYLSAQLQLHPDEAYYWLWSRHLDVAYFDHPPMVAYFIALTTLFSNSELWVRLSGSIVSLIVSGLTWRLAMQLFRSVQIAAGSVMLFNAYPLTLLGLTAITPDIPLLLFSSLSVYLFWQIIRSHQRRLWYAFGVSLGLALLSKYTAILLVPCLFGYLVLTEERRWLKTIHPYLSLLVAFFCFLPVLYWNSRHGWVSFAFQLRNGLGGAGPSLGQVATYLGGQMLLTGPVVWLLGVYAAGVGIGRREKEARFLIAAAIPVIVFFGLSSLSTVAGPNWPAFAYFAFSLLATQYCLDGSSAVRRALWRGAFVSSLSLSALATLHAKFSLIPLELVSKEAAAADATNWFYGWRELAAELKKYPGKEFVLTPSHQLSAEISYYTDARVPAQTDGTARPSQFNLWRWPAGLRGKDGLYVWSDGDAPGPYDQYFASTASANSLPVYRDGKAVRSYRIVAGEKSRGPPYPGHQP